MINEKLCYLCHVTDTIDDFVEYYCEIDNIFKKLKKIKQQYKQSKKKRSLSVNEKCIGVAITLEIHYSSCASTGVTNATESHFKGKDMKGKSSYCTASNLFDLNLKLAMGMFASSIGMSNMAQFLSILDIPNAKSLHKRCFQSMEATMESI